VTTIYEATPVFQVGDVRAGLEFYRESSAFKPATEKATASR
jgi:hypothetical protein